jgi:hypothetical protein
VFGSAKNHGQESITVIPGRERQLADPEFMTTGFGAWIPGSPLRGALE